jgi:hypothetical protein
LASFGAGRAAALGSAAGAAFTAPRDCGFCAVAPRAAADPADVSAPPPLAAVAIDRPADGLVAAMPRARALPAEAAELAARADRSPVLPAPARSVALSVALSFALTFALTFALALALVARAADTVARRGVVLGLLTTVPRGG